VELVVYTHLHFIQVTLFLLIIGTDFLTFFSHHEQCVLKLLRTIPIIPRWSWSVHHRFGRPCLSVTEC